MESLSNWKIENLCERHAAWYWGERPELMRALVAETFGKPGKR